MNDTNKFYWNRPKTQEEKIAIVDFLQMEAEIDAQNASMFMAMDKSHLTKGKINKMVTAINGRDGWMKSGNKLIKHYASVQPFSMNNERTWYR